MDPIKLSNFTIVFCFNDWCVQIVQKQCSTALVCNHFRNPSAQTHNFKFMCYPMYFSKIARHIKYMGIVFIVQFNKLFIDWQVKRWLRVPFHFHCIGFGFRFVHLHCRHWYVRSRKFWTIFFRHYDKDKLSILHIVFIFFKIRSPNKQSEEHIHKSKNHKNCNYTKIN